MAVNQPLPALAHMTNDRTLNPQDLDGGDRDFLDSIELNLPAGKAGAGEGSQKGSQEGTQSSQSGTERRTDKGTGSGDAGGEGSTKGKAKGEKKKPPSVLARLAKREASKKAQAERREKGEKRAYNYKDQKAEKARRAKVSTANSTPQSDNNALDLAGILQTLHSLIALKLEEPAFAITQAEAKQLEVGIKGVLEEYQVQFSGKQSATTNLLVTAGIIYTPMIVRAFAKQAEKPPRAPRKPVEAKAETTSGQTPPANPTRQSASQPKSLATVLPISTTF